MSLGCYGEYQSPLSVLPSCVKKCGQQVKTTLLEAGAVPISHSCLCLHRDS